MIQAMSTNRKQRRLQDKKAGRSKSPVNKKTQENAARAAELKAQGMALKAAGKEAEAVPLLKEALSLDSSLADVHFALTILSRTKPELGLNLDALNKTLRNKDALLTSYAAILGILKNKRQYKEAGICQEEFCRLLPKDPIALMNLGLIKNLSGGGEAATLDMARAVSMAPENIVIKNVFAGSLYNSHFSKFYPEVKDAIIKCFENIYDVNLHRLSKTWLALMNIDPLYSEFLNTSLMKDDNELIKWLENLNETSGSFLKDPYLIKGLRVLLVTDHHIEKSLTKLRRYIALNYASLTNSGRINLFEEFIYAFAEQCFLNEYVFYRLDDELNAVSELADYTDKIALGIVACYYPLYKMMPQKADILNIAADGNENFSSLVKTQFNDLRKEEELKASIPVFGKFANEISRKVQNQYEENPYPRWVTICSHPLPVDDIPEESLRNKPVKILVAGCGTGRQPIAAAARHPNASVVAIDLSKASLAYGMRKAQECGLANRIKFIQADILSMSDWDEEFDIIECSGVLHHMEDPFEGWRTLNKKLKKGGFYKIGLYSKIAREQILEARQFIEKNNFSASAEGIRECRKAVFELPTTDPMRIYLLNSSDFYATSLVRDLIFHVQEHQMTLAQIKEMMSKLGLISTKFVVSSPARAQLYDKMFPDDRQNRANMDNWAIIEEKIPLTFISMYQFWCKKII